MAKKSKTGNGNDYDVGYKKPPKSSQLKKGKSGNPSGKPKISIGIKEALMKEGEKEIVVSEMGKKIIVTKNEVVAKAAYALAHKGNLNAIKYLADNQPTEEPATLTAGFSWTDEQEKMWKRLSECTEDEEKKE